MKLILASASPRRKELLTLCGIPFIAEQADATEITQGTPEEVTRENALLKARAVAPKHPGDAILAADTVVYEPESTALLGKPRDLQDARLMLRLLSGKRHSVYTGVCLIAGGREQLLCEKADVYFTSLTDDTIEHYLAHESVLDKAGAYAIQGAAGMFVRRIEGSPTCVIGLPMEQVRALLEPYGLIY